jgi:hypothetical protein
MKSGVEFSTCGIMSVLKKLRVLEKFFVVLEFELRALQALYHLSHSLSPNKCPYEYTDGPLVGSVKLWAQV